MFRLPTCPHCGAIYRYKDTKEAIKNRKNECYHCRQKFKVRIFPGILAGIILPLALCIGLNIYLLSRMESLQFFPLLAVTLVFLLIIYLIIPFFIKFKKSEEKENHKE